MITALTTVILYTFTYFGSRPALDDNLCVIGYSMSSDNHETPIYAEQQDSFYNERVQYTLPSNETVSSLNVDEHGRRTLEEWEYQYYPYRCVVRLIAGFDDDGDGVADWEAYGTGCLVGPRTILSYACTVSSYITGWIGERL